MVLLMKYDQPPPKKSYCDRERPQNALILSVTSSCWRRGIVLLIHFFKISDKTSNFLTGTNYRNDNQNNDKIDKQKVKIEIPDTTSVCSTPLAGTSDTRISTKRGGGLFTK